MALKILKEAGIVILLLVIIVLILTIIFYDYFPNSKTIPAKVETYAFPEDIKEELSETLESTEQNIVRTYYIDSEDLSLYETTKEYDKGRVNPIADTNTNAITNTNTNNTSNTNSTSNNTSDNTTKNNTIQNSTGQNNVSSGEYFNKTGKY